MYRQTPFYITGSVFINRLRSKSANIESVFVMNQKSVFSQTSAVTQANETESICDLTLISLISQGLELLQQHPTSLRCLQVQPPLPTSQWWDWPKHRPTIAITRLTFSPWSCTGWWAHGHRAPPMFSPSVKRPSEALEPGPGAPVG